MLSNASKYTIKAMLYLMLHSNVDNKLGAKIISKALNVPEPFLAKLLQQLVKKNYLSSIKGPHGGFFISEQNSKNNVCDIIQAIDGHELFDSCFMELDKCDAQNPCPVHSIVVDFKENLFKKFKEIDLKTFAQEIDTYNRFLEIKPTI